MKRLIRRIWLPARARLALRRERTATRADDPGAEAAVAACLAWLCLAQDRSATHDDGVARHYSLIDGWAPSYPETTGYIVPTMIEQSRRTGQPALAARARRMLDWLVSIQYPEGGFRGGVISVPNPVPVTFNTGQILIGLACGVAEFGESYRSAMRAAADWLAGSLDPDGCWRKHPTPFAEPGDKSYETHVAWGLFEADRQDAGRGYAEAAARNIRWAMTRQRDNGWMDDCCLSDPEAPLTHTLGYALRGLVEAYRHSRDPGILGAAVKLADGLARCQGHDGSLPGRLRADWSAAVAWCCLTGVSQIAHSWIILSELAGRRDFADRALLANRFIRQRIQFEGDDNVIGGVAGSFPIDGEYGRFEYLNWAAKFTIDAQSAELALRG